MKSFISIQRLRDTGRETLGAIMDFEGIPFAVTLEPTWLNNIENDSCIPSGDYLCKRVDSPRFGDTFEITNVPGRTNILFHWGNVEGNTEGCILVAEKFGQLKGKPAILQSKSLAGEGFLELMDIVEDLNEFWLRITW